ncbi:prohibitin family protein [Prochlorothrix hollandica]|uniref:Band 7 domain-containing protein n=1 Tax=Prochlorothrix hollandica PCC 9006 = CALU 1027 TaxID=317619 RepID=A0A0M2PUJ8_PROHO|nr:prohibitin family protein [Prochlorothrix hollandica]KKI99794.1 hypothetical protein PROH_08005 [Prochlorothrix hollandica PCC 9006 = CALU 1027]
MRQQNGELLIIGGLVIAGLVVVGSFSSSAFEIVSEGTEGVRIFNGKAGQVVNPGFHFKTPVLADIIQFDTTVQTYDPPPIRIPTQEQAGIELDAAVIWRMTPGASPMVYRNYQTLDRLAQATIHRELPTAINSVTAQYPFSDLTSRRSAIQAEIETQLREQLLEIDAPVSDVNVNLQNFIFPEAITQAIQQKLEQEQLTQKAQLELQRVKAEAEAKVATAEGEARANRALSTAITPQLLELRKLEVQQQTINKWNGVMPVYMGSGQELITLPQPTPSN